MSFVMGCIPKHFSIWSLAIPAACLALTTLVSTLDAAEGNLLSELREPAEPIETEPPHFDNFTESQEFSDDERFDDRFAGFESQLPPRFFSSEQSSSDWLENVSVFGGIDGSKQPQDFGVNANIGLQAHINAGFALDEQSGLGLHLGTGIVGSQNAVRVYELLGEARNRVQSFSTVGLFQRSDTGFLWALGHDFLIEESYDSFVLSQWRGRVGYDADDRNQFGITAQLRALEDSGDFNGGLVSLRTINQASVYWRYVWESQTQTTVWLGLADGHGENNAVVGPAPAKDTVPLVGADFLAPLNDHLALYGETNLIMPSDTGTVDAFLGFQWFPGGGARRSRRTPFAPVMPVASPTNVSVDLR